jgi:hypothetical protein
VVDTKADDDSAEIDQGQDQAMKADPRDSHQYNLLHYHPLEKGETGSVVQDGQDKADDDEQAYNANNHTKYARRA